MEVNEKSLLRITGLWKRKGKNGVEYYAGEMSRTTSLFLFSTRSSRGSGNKPEFIVYIGQTKGSGDPESDITPGVANFSGDPT